MIDGPDMSPATLAFLRESPLGADAFEWLEGEDLPPPSRMLLVHEGDMTSTL